MPDLDSTLLRHGRAATSFGDMVAFAEMVESRPMIKLLEDLPGIAELSETKFHLALKVLRRRFRGESAVDQLQLRIIADEIAGTIEENEPALRIRSLFAMDEA